MYKLLCCLPIREIQLNAEKAHVMSKYNNLAGENSRSSVNSPLSCSTILLVCCILTYGGLERLGCCILLVHPSYIPFLSLM